MFTGSSKETYIGETHRLSQLLRKNVWAQGIAKENEQETAVWEEPSPEFCVQLSAVLFLTLQLT